MVSVYQLDVCNGSLGDEIEAHQFLPLWDRKAGIALPSFLCPAAIGLIGPLYQPMQTLDVSYNALSSAIDDLAACGSVGMPECAGTHVGAGMIEANALFDANPSDPELGRAMVIVGDGSPNAKGPNAGMTNDQLKDIARQQADAAAAQDISVYTIFYDENNDDTAANFFESLVRGDGKALRTPDPAQLPDMLEEICAQVPPRLVQ